MKTKEDFIEDLGLHVFAECKNSKFTVTDIHCKTNPSKNFLEIVIQYTSPRNVKLLRWWSASGPNAELGFVFRSAHRYKGEMNSKFEVGIQALSQNPKELYKWDFVGHVCERYSVILYFKKKEPLTVYHIEE